MKHNALKVPVAGWIVPKCEKMEEEVIHKRKETKNVVHEVVVPSEAENQAKLEQERGYIRNLNSKLIDNKI